jgi:5-phospho-D-xylono-1,4-lactonase
MQESRLRGGIVMSSVAGSSAGFVRTVGGDILPEDVGFAHCHEHTFILPGPSCRANPELLLDDLEKTTAELREFFAAGGRTVVDAQPIGPERSPDLQRAASERSGVHIVATTGFHRAMYYEADHFRFRETAEELAARLVAEITDGMAEYVNSTGAPGGASGGGTPGVLAGGGTPRVFDGRGASAQIRAGLLKFASDYHVIDAQSRKAAEAVAIAHHKTGAPILTHTEFGTCGMEQVKLFRTLGVEPSSLLVSHLDRNPDLSVHEEIADTGAYLVYDGVSRIKHHPDSTIVRLICRLAEAGLASRILLGMDMAPRSMWRAYGGGPGMTYLGNVFLVSLRKAGLGNEQITMFTEYNPASALTFRRPAA